MLSRFWIGWNFMRIVRLSIGIAIGVQAIETREPISAIFSAYFLFQAVTNTGCCSTAQCGLPVRREMLHKVDDVQYEEIKP
jgi:hypothetical protein